MRRQLLTIGITLGFIFLIALAVVWGIRLFTTWNGPGIALSSVHEFVGRSRVAILSASRAWYEGTDPVLSLETELGRMRAEIGALQDISEENEFLRKIADLPSRGEHDAVVGGVFSYGVSGQRIEMVLNKGERDGIVRGSSVVTESSTIVGIVDQVRERTSTVIVVGDVSLQITGRIAGADTAGLVRVDPTGQLVFDLVGKDEVVTEGSVVVASGLDRVPAGLIIGTVRSVNADTTSLFQEIYLDPAFAREVIWRVIILMP